LRRNEQAWGPSGHPQRPEVPQWLASPLSALRSGGWRRRREGYQPNSTIYLVLSNGKYGIAFDETDPVAADPESTV